MLDIGVGMSVHCGIGSKRNGYPNRIGTNNPIQPRITLDISVRRTSDAARHNHTCGKSTVQPHVWVRVVNVR
jgi:hypothetical protein